MIKKYILIVDRDKYLIRYLRYILESKGYEVDTSDTGTNALKKLRDNFYNIIIMEMDLPDMSGTDLIAEISQIRPETIKIIFTAYATLEGVISSLNLGTDAYVLKHLKSERLIEVIDEKLIEQEKASLLDEDKVKEWLENRLLNLERDYTSGDNHIHLKVS